MADTREHPELKEALRRLAHYLDEAAAQVLYAEAIAEDHGIGGFGDLKLVQSELRALHNRANDLAARGGRD